MTEDRIKNRIERFIGVSGIRASVLYSIGKWEKAHYCVDCGDCDFKRTHRYGAFEAMRWNGKYIYDCSRGFTFMAATIGGENCACIAGPVIAESTGDFQKGVTPEIPVLSSKRINDCAELLQMLFHNIEDSSHSDSAEAYNPFGKIIVTENCTYPIELEKKLQSAIINGEEGNSKEYLNLLLGHIYFSSEANFEIIKHRIIELIVLLSRSAIASGADINQILMLNTDYFLKIEKIKTFGEMNLWLSTIINRFVGYVFEFTDVKHTDIMCKVVRYIREHYSEKLTLDVICRETALSKAYLSQIFNEEMKCSISQYINKVRIQKSKLLLPNNSISLLDISGLVGFGDQSYFTKVFKKLEGVSPGEYRKKSQL